MPVLGIDASRAVKKEKTGVEWYSYFLLRAMEKCTPPEWKVRLYVPALPPPESSPIKGEEKISSPPLMGGVRGGWKWKELKWIGRGWTQGRLSLEMMKSPPDVLFVPSHTIPVIHPARTVTTVHDVIFLAHPELYSPDDLVSQKRGYEFALQFAKKIIVPTRAVRDEVVGAGGRAEQIVVVPHGVDSEWRMENGEWRMAARVTAPYLLYIGRIEKKKNVLGLVQAFRYLCTNYESVANTTNSLKLVLAGQIGYGGEDVLQAIKTFNLGSRVVHLGYVSRVEYLNLLTHAALLVVPSFGEGFGLPVLEAMVAGTPVVCSDLSVLHEVGGNAVQYVNPNDPDDIARGMREVLQNDMLQSEMIRSGKERALEFTWERTAKETWDVVMGL